MIKSHRIDHTRINDGDPKKKKKKKKPMEKIFQWEKNSRGISPINPKINKILIIKYKFIQET